MQNKLKGGCGIIASERNTFSWSFILSLLNLQREMGKEFEILYSQTGDQATARNTILQTAKEAGLDYVIMIDSDMTFPPFGVKLLLDIMKKYVAKMATGLYFVGPMLNKSYEIASYEMTDGKLFPVKEHSEPRLIDSCGMGFTLIMRDLFDIKFAFSDGLGEDFYFCREAKKLGTNIVLDPRVQCGHLRMFEVNESLIKKING